MRSSFAPSVVFAALVAATTPVFAAFTPVNPPPYGDDTHREVLSVVYGGNFQPVPGTLDLSNGSLVAVRIDDYQQSVPTGPEQIAPTNLVGGPMGSDDQFWQADFRLASAEAIFGVYRQEFGYFDGISGGNYVKLFDQTGYGYNVDGSADLSSLSGHVLRWARGGENRVLSSLPSDNADGLDHMVTYRIDGLADARNLGMSTWVLMWEDKYPWEQNADFDYEDMVVQIKAMPIPEPTMAGLLLAGALLGISTFRGKRRRKPE